MNINASIIDQRLSGIIEEYASLLPHGDDNKKRFAAFVLLCISTALDIELSEAAELLTEGGNDAGVDGIYIGEMDDSEFEVIIFQGKYKIKDLSGTANFPENGVQKAVNTVQVLFDPAKKISLNPQLEAQVEEIRSLIRDGYIPNVKVVLCNNGVRWTEQAQSWIEQSRLTENQVQWIHFNHNSILEILRKTTPVNDSLKLSGVAVFDAFDFKRVVVGKVQVTEIAELFNKHQDLLLQRNIRRYLGLNENRVNLEIHNTLVDTEDRKNFYFFNNGITIICRKFRHNALQNEDYLLKLEGMQVINGGQTCKTIQQTLNKPELFADYHNTYVLVRIYELEDENQDFVTDITYATNSQNPVDLRDLRSNDDIQKSLEEGLKDLGYIYKRQREAGGFGPNIINSSVAAEAALAIWRKKPQQAKFRRKEHFGKLYEEIFADLNASQLVLAVLIFREVENKRKQKNKENSPSFIPYASHYISMLIGHLLISDNGMSFANITHKNFEILKEKFNSSKDYFYEQALQKIKAALMKCYGDREISLQQLSATFRRGDLLEMLEN